MAQGYFTECPLSDNSGDKPLVIYVPEDGRHYRLELSGVTRRELDSGFARNGAIVAGNLEGDHLIAQRYTAPQARKQALFKGCL